MREILRLLRIREEIGGDDVAAVRVDLDAQHVGRDDDVRRRARRRRRGRRRRCRAPLRGAASARARHFAGARRRRRRRRVAAARSSSAVGGRAARCRGCSPPATRPEQVAEEQQRDQEQVAGTRHGDRFTRAGRRPASGRGGARGQGGGVAASENGRRCRKIRRALCRCAALPFNVAACGESPPQRFEIGAQRRVVVRIGAFARDQQDVDRRAARRGRLRKLSRAMRLMRLRRTASVETRRDTARPSARGAARAGGGLGVEMTARRRAAPVGAGARKSAGLTTRAACGKRAPPIAERSDATVRPRRRDACGPWRDAR